MERARILFLQLIIFIGLFYTPAFGNNDLRSRVQTEEYQYWFDHTNSATALDVIKDAKVAQWQTVPLGKSSFGSSTSTLWLRFQIKEVPPGIYYHCFNFALLNSVDWFMENNGQVIPVSQSGIATPYSQYTVPFYKPCASIKVSTQPEVVFVKLHARGPLDFSSSLYSSSSFEDWKHYWSLINVGFCACIAVALIQFLFLFTAFKKRIFLYFSGHVCFMFINANTYSGSILTLFDNNTFLMQRLQPLSGALSWLFFVLLMRDILSEHFMSALMKKVTNVMLIVLYSCFPFAFLLHPAADAYSAINCLWIALAIIIILCHSSFSQVAARYTLAGFLIYFVAVIIHVLKAFGVISPYWLFEILPHLGLISESLFLGFAVLHNTSDMTRLIAESNTKLIKLNEVLQQEIEERNQIEMELVKERKRAIETARFKSIAQISGNIAHEINTPLSIISFKTQNLLMTLKNATLDVAFLQTEIGSIVGLVNKTSEIVQCIRMLGRDSSKEPFVQLNLASLFKEVIGLYAQVCKKVGIKVEISGLDPEFKIRARNAGLFQIFSNLMSNAIDALKSSSDDKEKLIKIEIKIENGFLRIAFSNNGLIIAPENKEHIFEPFFSTKPGGVGVGLGLSLSQEIAANHQGTLALDSSLEPEFTRFVLSIPT